MTQQALVKANHNHKYPTVGNPIIAQNTIRKVNGYSVRFSAKFWYNLVGVLPLSTGYDPILIWVATIVMGLRGEHEGRNSQRICLLGITSTLLVIIQSVFTDPLSSTCIGGR